MVEGGEDEGLYIVPEGTVIWPERGGRGVVQKPFAAVNLKEKVNGLTGFRSCGEITLYFDGRFWTLPRDTRFGAYAQNLKEIKMK